MPSYNGTANAGAESKAGGEAKLQMENGTSSKIMSIQYDKGQNVYCRGWMEKYSKQTVDAVFFSFFVLKGNQRQTTHVEIPNFKTHPEYMCIYIYIYVRPHIHMSLYVCAW